MALTPIQSRALENPAFLAKNYTQLGVVHGALMTKAPGNYQMSQFFGAGSLENHAFGGYVSNVSAGTSPYRLIQVAGQYSYTVSLKDSARVSLGLTAEYGNIQLNTSQLIFSDQIDVSSSVLTETSEEIGPAIKGSRAVLGFGALCELKNAWLSLGYFNALSLDSDLYGLLSGSRVNFQGGVKFIIQDKSVDKHHELVLLYPEMIIRLDEHSDYSIGATLDLDHLYGQNGVFYFGGWLNQELDFSNASLRFTLGLRQQNLSVFYSNSVPISGIQSSLGLSHQVGLGLNIQGSYSSIVF